MKCLPFLNSTKIKPDHKSIIDTPFLYVILPYFNFCHSKRRKQLFLEFIQRNIDRKDIRIIIAEATENGYPFDIPANITGIFRHIGLHTNDCIWLKENLINMAVKQLPNDWEYVAWIDADITFLNNDWPTKTIESLITYDIVQMFQTCINLGPTEEAIKVDKSFGYMHLHNGHEWISSHKYGFWHPGFAWACTRRTFETMQGLIDYAILGSGDHHMALALVNKVACSYPSNIHPSYKEQLHQFQERCRQKSLKLGYVPGSIVHYWHGRLQDRKYRERWQILVENNYSPMNDIYYAKSGAIQLTTTGKRFAKDITQYFVDRKEDNMTIE